MHGLEAFRLQGAASPMNRGCRMHTLIGVRSERERGVLVFLDVFIVFGCFSLFGGLGGEGGGGNTLPGGSKNPLGVVF